MALLKGTLDVLVLKALSWGPMHGFEITSWLEQRSGGRIEVVDAALLQALHRMEERGLISAEWGITRNGRRARYYQLTDSGRDRLKNEGAELVDHVKALTTILMARTANHEPEAVVDIQREPHSRRWMYAAWSAALLAVVLISLGLGRLQPAAPAVERGTLWFGVVERGEMIREVHAAGTLVPEHVRIVAAVTAGRVERLPVRLGDTVGRGTIIVEPTTRTSSSRRSNRTRRRRALGARWPAFVPRSFSSGSRRRRRLPRSPRSFRPPGATWSPRKDSI